MSKNEILSRLRELRDTIGRDYRAEVVGIFGSYARGEEEETSDLDVLVIFKEKATILDLVGLSDFLGEQLQCKVDVVSRRALRKEIEPYVMKDLVAL